ncbi:MAG TPA: carbonic anhydrase [Bryobacteraceae bacterium]|nr:carbonic anhydrase [Bryobacteraceae bacterium]
MLKRFHFDSPIEVYRADAAVLWCFDDRITLVVQKFLKRISARHVDTIRIAGGAMALASPKDNFEQGFVIEQLRLSRKLHQTERVILVAHRDCGAYGGSARFQGDAEAEVSFHRAELARAAEVIRTALPEVTVEHYFADFDGVWEVEAARSAGAD